MAGARKSVEQEQGGGDWTAGLPVEDFDAIDLNGTVVDGHGLSFDFELFDRCVHVLKEI